MHKEVLRSNTILTLLLALQDKDVSVQEDGLVGLLKIPREEKQQFLKELDRRVARPELAAMASEVLGRQL